MEDLNVDRLLGGEDDYELDITEEKEKALLDEEDDWDQEQDDTDILILNDEREKLTEDDSLTFDSKRDEAEKRKIKAPTPTPEVKRQFKSTNMNNKNNTGKKFSSNNNRGGQRPLKHSRPQPKRNKTVLINPRFKGTVHVNGPSAWLPAYQQKNQPVVWMNRPPAANPQPCQTVPPVIYAQQQLPNMQQIQQPMIPQHQIMQQQPFFPQQEPVFTQQQMMPLQQMVPQQQIFQHQQPVVPQQQTMLQVPQWPQQHPPQQQYQQEMLQQPSLENIQVQVNTKPPVHQRLGIPQQQYNQAPEPYNSEWNNGPANYNSPHQMTYETSYQPPPFIPPNAYPNSNQDYREDQYNNNYRSGHNRMTNNKNKWRNNQTRGQNKFNTYQQRKNNSNTNNQIVKENNPAPAAVPENENEDDEMRQYRLQIEEQKKAREEVLRKKEENRRKILESQMSSPKKSPVQTQRSFNNKNFSHNNIIITGNNAPTSRGRTGNNMPASRGKIANNRFNKRPPMPVHKPWSNLTMIRTVENIGTASSSFLAERQISNEPALLETKTVLVRNLASSTDENRLTQMGCSFGNVQKLLLDKQERQAKIHFDNVESAHAFFKKYRRCMIDLSMIQVELIPDIAE